MISKDDFLALKAYFQLEGAVLPDKTDEELYAEFVEKRDNSDFCMQASSEDARYDAEMDIAEEVLLCEMNMER
jgi:hypothetical protein